ncbi:MAG TPA: FAD-dependent monooxygenase [Gammaproteobacteria bacterium]|nr:FAD-dependent monooxygenase [Gammaproteobacteria bacterium]
MSADDDIIIVGAGFVGLTLACALARKNKRIRLLEARALTDNAYTEDGRALALSSKSCQILTELVGSLPPHTPLANVEVSQQGRFGKLHLQAQDVGLASLGSVIPAPVLGAHLFKQAQREKNIAWQMPAKVTQYTQQDNAVTVVLDDARQLTAKLLILAEGAHSITRTQAFATFTHDYQQMALTANVSLTSLRPQHAYQRFTDHATLALLPLNPTRATLVLTVKTADHPHWQALSDADFLAQAQTLLGFKLGVLSDLGKRHAYPLQAVFVEKAYDGRVLLMGNAAHTLNPVAAQGLNLSLRDIAVFTELFQDADLADGHTVSERLAQYQSLRLNDQKNMLRLTDGLVKLTSRPSLKWARSLGLLALDVLPGAKRRLYDYLLGV